MNDNIKLSYYKLDRACKIIECEVDDIIHMWLTGAIKLHVDLKGVDCYLTKYYPKISENMTKNEINLLNIIDVDLYKETNISRSLKWFSYSNDDFSVRPVEHTNDVVKFDFHGRAYGIWEISPTIVTRFVENEILLTSRDNIDRTNSTNEACFVLGYESRIKEFPASDYLSFEDKFYIKKSDIIILPEDFDKLNVKKWGELPSYLNGEKKKDESHKEQDVAILDGKPVIQGRVSDKIKMAIRIMSKKLYPNTYNSPTNLANSLTADAEEQGLKGVRFDDTTVGRWLKD